MEKTNYHTPHSFVLRRFPFSSYISFPNEFSGSVLLRFLSLGVIVFVRSFARGLANSLPVYFYTAGGRRLNFECTGPSTVVLIRGSLACVLTRMSEN